MCRDLWQCWQLFTGGARKCEWDPSRGSLHTIMIIVQKVLTLVCIPSIDTPVRVFLATAGRLMVYSLCHRIVVLDRLYRVLWQCSLWESWRDEAIQLFRQNSLFIPAIVGVGCWRQHRWHWGRPGIQSNCFCILDDGFLFWKELFFIWIVWGYSP